MPKFTFSKDAQGYKAGESIEVDDIRAERWTERGYGEVVEAKSDGKKAKVTKDATAEVTK